MNGPRGGPRRGLVAVAGAGAFALAAACAETTYPRWIDDVRPTVDSLYLLPGATARVEAAVFDQRGDPMPGEWIPRIAWSLTDSSVAAIDVDDTGAVLTGLEPGLTRLVLQLGRGEEEVPIYVLPPGLDSIAVDPPELILGRFTERGVEARLFDADGHELSREGHRISWSMEDTAIAYLPSGPDGAEQASVRSRNRVGETRVRLHVDDRLAYGRVLVTSAPPPLQQLQVRTVSDTSLQVSWEEQRDASDGYRLYRADAQDGPYVHIASPGIDRFFSYLDTVYVDAELQPATTYWYQVEACNDEACSVRSAWARGTTADAAGTPRPPPPR